MNWTELLRAGLEDDDWQWDWTSLGSSGRLAASHAVIIAKADGVWAADAGLDAVEAVSASLRAPLRVKRKVKDGAKLKPGQLVCEWSGPSRMLLALERPFLNLASYTGGIASHTALLVGEIRRAWKKSGAKGVVPRVTSTRKTLPLYRDLAVQAVRAGGGHSHRISLSGGVLIKENHIASAGGIRRAIEGVRAIAPHGLRIEIEVTSLAELDQALTHEADAVLLDNFTPAQARAALLRLRRADRRVLVEISGGLNERNIGEYALPGVDVLSVGALTHSVRAIDLSLLIR